MPIVMGTAGHIDHGKTTLIKALTGIDCDRLKDEKKRGITIELGFAYLDLPSGIRLSIVDVPGHERFVKNMVAGASGIDFVLLTVAADEGIMPQTEEHIEICSLLGIEMGVVALTKIDMVDQELLGLAEEDVSSFLSRTFLRDAPVVPVSSYTGEGLDRLIHTLDDIVSRIRDRKSSDIFVLPVDRVFTMKGHGTVVTGTLVSGEIRVGEDVMIYPSVLPSKVRHIQVHGESVEVAPAGRRTAINLANVEVEDLERGHIVARPNTLFPSRTWDVEIHCLSSSPRPIQHRKEVHFHHGTSEVMARIYLLEGDRLDPGESGFAQVRFDRDMVGVFGDRFVIRSFSPLRTIGGGKILSPISGKIKRLSPDVEDLKKLSRGELTEVVKLHLKRAGKEGLNFPVLHILTNVSSRNLENILQRLLSSRDIYLMDREKKIYISGKIVEELVENLREYVRAYHSEHPLLPGISRSQILSHWGKGVSQKLVHFIIELSLKRGVLASEEDVLKLPEHKIALNKDQKKIREQVVNLYKRAGSSPPSVKKVAQELSLNKGDLENILRLLVEEGVLVKIKDELFFYREAVELLRDRVIALFKEKEEMSPRDFKELSGLSRKYSIPLLEYFDREKLTIRVGDVRKLRKR